MRDSQIQAMQLITIMIASMLLLAVFQSSALVTLAYDLPEGGPSGAIVSLAETWHAAMETLGIAQLSQGIADTMETARSSEIQSEF